MKGYCAIQKALSLDTQPRSDVPVAASDDQPAFACAHTRMRHRALSLSRGGAARALAAYARRAAQVGVGPFPMKAHCVIEKALSLSARPCSDVPAAAFREQPSFAWAHTRMRHRALSLGRRRSTRAYGMCAPLCAG